MMNNQRHLQGSQAYSKVSLESSIMGASSHQLISMLFDGAHRALVRARIAKENGDIAARGSEISKAINIVGNGLLGALDHEKGGTITPTLEQLYNYMIQMLLQGNLTADMDIIAHVDHILLDIADAWNQIA